MKLYTRHWPVAHPYGAIALVHGAAEHSGRYEDFAKDCNEAGYAVMATDLPGHGRSEGRRGHVHSFTDYIDTVNDTFTKLAAVYPTMPTILIGHSMGGLTAIRFLQTRNIPDTLCAAVLSSPCLDLSFEIPTIQLYLAKIVDRIWPTFSQSNGIKPENVTRSTEVISRDLQDSFILHKVTARWFMELQRSMAAARNDTQPFPVPTLILQAGSDRLVSASTVQKFAEQLHAPVKEFRLYPDCFHELFNEPEREQILADMFQWLKNSIPSTSPSV